MSSSLKIAGAICAGVLLVLGIGVATQWRRQEDERARRQRQRDKLDSLSPDELLARCGKPLYDGTSTYPKSGRTERRLNYEFVYDEDERKYEMIRGETDPNKVQFVLGFDFERAKDESKWTSTVLKNTRVDARNYQTSLPDPEFILSVMPCLK